MSSLPDYGKLIWAYKCELGQFYIDHRLGAFIVISLILLYGVFYYSLPDQSVKTVLTAPRFWTALGLLLVTVAISAYLTRKPIPPPEDGKLYVTFTNLGCAKEKEGEILRENIEKGLSRVVEISPSLRLMKSTIQETVKNTLAAEKYGRQRGVHFVIYGHLRGAVETGKVEYEGGVVQVWPFQGAPSLGHYSLAKYFDAYDPEQVKSFSRDIVVKLLKLYHANIGDLRNNQISFSRTVSSGVSAFNLGSNLVKGFMIGHDLPGEPFLIGHTGADGKLVLSGRLFDSDGTHAIEIRENQADQAIPGDIFDVRYSGDSFFIRDPYERLLLQVKQEKELKNFVDTYLRDSMSVWQLLKEEAERRFKEHMAQLPNHLRREFSAMSMNKDWEQERRELMSLNSIVTVTGEIYNTRGIPLVFIENNRLLQYTNISIRLN